jgi:hypothetical protein
MEMKDDLNLENWIWPKFPPPNILLKFKINQNNSLSIDFRI